MTNNGIVNIHGKEYMTVAKRVELAHADKNFDSLTTEVLNDSPVVVKATVTIKGKVFTGISAANPTKSIEKQSPYEVAETSAVGRALGFAGYGIIEGIASADEMHKAGVSSEPSREEVKESKVCPKDGGKLIERTTKTGKTYLKCENGGWDPENQVATGCDYVLWSSPKTTWDKRDPYKSGKTMKAEDYDDNKHEYSDLDYTG